MNMQKGSKAFFYLIIMEILSLTILGRAARAEAPFCTQSLTSTPQCYYDDADICRKEAGVIGGNCVVNEAATALPQGYGNYCLVITATTVQCLYLDYNSCNQDALRQNGICMRNYTKPEPLPSYEYQGQDAYQTF
ncbi:MAG TPA: hypothetical protein DCM27_01385 [Rhodospirillaceae bacterium]|nr:hypothetical protein [Rhodospirillaceae bacterium]